MNKYLETKKLKSQISVEDLHLFLTSGEPRSLFMYKSHCGHNELGIVFFVVEGTPPRGIAVYMVAKRILVILSVTGQKRIKRNVFITNLSAFKDIDVVEWN